VKLGILFNCQVDVLAAVARRALPDAEVVAWNIGYLIPDAALRHQALAELATCDHVLALKLDADQGELANDAMRPAMRRLTVLPGFSFGGFHPDTVYITTPQGFLGGYTHHYHSRIALAGFLNGRSPARTAALYNALVMGRGGYFDAYAQEMALACSLFDSYGLDLRPMFERWARRGCFMHSLNHPKSWCYAEICAAQLRHAGLIASAPADLADMDDPLHIHPTHPVLPPLARRLGVPAETGFRPFDGGPQHVVPVERFVELEYESFMAARTQDLETAPGVAHLRAVIG